MWLLPGNKNNHLRTNRSILHVIKSHSNNCKFVVLIIKVFLNNEQYHVIPSRTLGTQHVNNC